MQTRVLGCTGKLVPIVGLGTWQIGGDWADVDDSTAFDILGAAVEARLTLFDTADVYGDGHSEQSTGRFLRDRSDADVFVAIKMGRRVEQVRENYVLRNFREGNDRSRRNLGVQCLDLVQLHFPPAPVYSRDEVYNALDTMVDEGRISNHGVSFETVPEALTAIARPRVASVQVILYKNRLTGPDFWAAVRSTVTFTIVGVFGSWLAGLGLALLLRTSIAGRGTFKVLLPWVVPVVVTSTSSRNWLLATPDSPIPKVAKALRFGDVLFLANPIALMMTFVLVLISSVLYRHLKRAAIQ